METIGQSVDNVCNTVIRTQGDSDGVQCQCAVHKFIIRGIGGIYPVYTGVTVGINEVKITALFEYQIFFGLS